MSKEIIPAASIAQSIHLLRGQKVLLDFDLAALYRVGTKVLNQAVKRNRERFPADFMFRLTPEEIALLRSQIVTLDRQHPETNRVVANWSYFVTGSGKPRGTTYRPYAFTESPRYGARKR